MKNNNNDGFTLIELLIVIGIIGVLATLMTAAVRYARERARVAKAQFEIDQINTAASVLANDSNFWPGHLPAFQACAPGTCIRICDGCAYGLVDGYAGLAANDTAAPFPGWRGPYMNEFPLDAWGHQYFFDTDYSTDVDNAPCAGSGIGCATSVVIGSAGPDGSSDDSGNNANNADDVVKVIYK